MKDLNALHVFIAIYQTGSTLRAATRLGRSQSYVSKVLAQLREDLNDPLFIRTSVSLSPTSYADEIAPKLQEALNLVNYSLQPQDFDPANISRISIHMIEPYILGVGKEVINTIRQFTDAEIELKCWAHNSEGLIEDEKVDVGFHVLKDRPQIYSQIPLVGVSGELVGKKDSELIKYVSPGINDHIDYFKQMDSNAHASIFIDHCGLLDQLMENYQCYRHIPITRSAQNIKPHLSLALIFKTSQKNSQKNKWLRELLTPILESFKII
ncbi:LysR family transcriptional regulator [Psychromonas sp. RZ22]|uniref:LysR family transcriptional regulator n=1 Tax=Psychromonas algarum TaxID=2555643 RepID=UPI0010682EC9|nr:LysR family transcriptional regulator [Psychromonas sp. RZ22]TEW54832.1 LysR family transcriptional regulator [Psychromonas sp. RZ22]